MLNGQTGIRLCVSWRRGRTNVIGANQAGNAAATTHACSGFGQRGFEGVAVDN